MTPLVTNDACALGSAVRLIARTMRKPHHIRGELRLHTFDPSKAFAARSGQSLLNQRSGRQEDWAYRAEPGRLGLSCRARKIGPIVQRLARIEGRFVFSGAQGGGHPWLSRHP
jgi:hypothetical protein